MTCRHLQNSPGGGVIATAIHVHEYADVAVEIMTTMVDMSSSIPGVNVTCVITTEKWRSLRACIDWDIDTDSAPISARRPSSPRSGCGIDRQATFCVNVPALRLHERIFCGPAHSPTRRGVVGVEGSV